MYKPCVVIPVYNHGNAIGKIVKHICELGLDCFLVDDGSDQPCQQILQQTASENKLVHLLQLEQNSGKGIAVCNGLREAYGYGFSCALQIDADGQHDINDISKFLDEARKHPDNVICGVRFTKNEPKSRRYGRSITNFWVWVHTLSTQIKDSMCGYRVYPLKSTVTLLDKVKVGARMNFDTDILVRLYWAGLNVTQLPTKVIYSDESPSHFQMVSDNWRITVMHTKLFFGMLVRAPALLWRNISNLVFKHA